MNCIKTGIFICIICIPSVLFSESPIDTTTCLKTNTASILKQILCSSEAGDTISETRTIYSFKFDKNPKEYFYQYKSKENEIIFSFTRTISEINTDSIINCPPIKAITIKNDNDSTINVIVKFDKLPKIYVNDSGNVAKFYYKWTSDTNKISKYIVGKERTLDGWWTVIPWGLLLLVGLVVFVAVSNN
jgi:hypothetical protein